MNFWVVAMCIFPVAGIFFLILFKIRRGGDTVRNKELQRSFDEALWMQEMYRKNIGIYEMICYRSRPWDLLHKEMDRQIRLGMLDRVLLEAVYEDQRRMQLVPRK